MTAPTPLLLALLATSAAAQTDVLYSIPKPPTAHSDWGTSLVALPDIDADGVGELGIGTRTHGGGLVAWVHSGASGAELYDLTTPGALLFFGQRIVPVDDRNGDGVPDLVLIGHHSGAGGSPDGRFHLHSGADGAFLESLSPPAGIILVEGPAIPFGDVDGDGHVDILCRAAPVPAIGSPQVQLFSGATGAALYLGVPADPSSSIGNALVRIEDRDGDGVDDFAASGSDTIGSRVDLRSGQTGQVIQVLRGPGIGLQSGNNEPLVRTPDRDSDGLDDLATGSFFELLPGGQLGAVRNFSTADGSQIDEWLPSPSSNFFGFLMIAPGDFDLDGTDDLLTVERRSDAQGNQIGTALLGISLDDASILFDELVPTLGSIHVGNLGELPGVDPNEFATFADLEVAASSIKVRRFAPEVGTTYCASTPNSTGKAAAIRALGLESIAADHFVLEAHDVVPSKIGLFFYGPEMLQVPFGHGFLCVGAGTTGVARLPAALADANGRLTHRLDFAHPPTAATTITPSSTWNFQAWFRDPAMPFGSQTSDAVSVTFLP
jgi:FG-GAP-like repeat